MLVSLVRVRERTLSLLPGIIIQPIRVELGGVMRDGRRFNTLRAPIRRRGPAREKLDDLPGDHRYKFISSSAIIYLRSLRPPPAPPMGRSSPQSGPVRLPKTMATERQIQANRANGKRSTGPVTEEGKQASSQNARRHGQLSSCIVLKAESARSSTTSWTPSSQSFNPAPPMRSPWLKPWP